MEHDSIIEFANEYKKELIIGAALAFMVRGYLLDKYGNYKDKNGNGGSISEFIKKSLEEILHKSL